MDGKATQINTSQAESKRSAQWVPVYSWLESLDKTEVVKSREISEWLSENPEVKEQLYSRYTHQHLMHYIQKCHSRLLKRPEKGKESSVIAPLKSHEDEKNKAHVPLPCISSSNIAEGNDKYLAKRNEAFLKYNILFELEKHLAVVFRKSELEKKSRDLSCSSQRDGDVSHNQ